MTRLTKQGFWEGPTTTYSRTPAECWLSTSWPQHSALATKRREWDQYDLQFGDVGVEVKSAAYVQAWKQAKPSKITFSIRPARGWDPITETFAESAERSAAVYVLRLLEGEDRDHIDPLDVGHWAFYVLATSELERHVPDQTTIRLGRLKELGARKCTYDELNAAIHAAAARRLPRGSWR